MHRLVHNACDAALWPQATQRRKIQQAAAGVASESSGAKNAIGRSTPDRPMQRWICRRDRLAASP
jgi:hypothetical protein